MSILKYFQALLPTPEQTGIGERATTSANTDVSKQLKLTGGKKRKAYTAFSDEDQAKIGKHDAENGNSSALKKFRRVYPDLGESTVCSFKRKYYEVLKEQARQSGRSAIVESIPSQKRGRPLTLGNLDNEVQQYVRALQTAGTPVGSTVIIAAVRGIVMAKKSSLASRK